MSEKFPAHWVQAAIEYRAERAKREKANGTVASVRSEMGAENGQIAQNPHKPAERAKAIAAAPTTVEAVMYSLRERGVKALAEPDCQRRLSELSRDQRREVVKRLLKLRPKYPAISNELIFRLSEKRP